MSYALDRIFEYDYAVLLQQQIADNTCEQQFSQPPPAPSSLPQPVDIIKKLYEIVNAKNSIKIPLLTISEKIVWRWVARDSSRTVVKVECPPFISSQAMQQWMDSQNIEKLVAPQTIKLDVNIALLENEVPETRVSFQCTLELFFYINTFEILCNVILIFF